MVRKAPRVTKICVACGQPFEVRVSQTKRHKSCGKPECIRKAYSLAKINMSVESRNKIGKTRREKFARGEIKSRLGEFRLSSSNDLTESEKIIAPFLAELGFIPHWQINTGLAPRNGNAHIYIVDFAHLLNRFYIEIDGRGHYTLKAQEQDKKRDAFLSQLGWQGLRITNDEVLNNIKSAKSKILNSITTK